jgi:hypothetical protein
MLSRNRLDDDRRRQPLSLTEHGQRALRSAQTTLGERLAGLLADMAPRETDALARLLLHLEASLSGTPPPPRPPRPADAARTEATQASLTPRDHTPSPRVLERGVERRHLGLDDLGNPSLSRPVARRLRRCQVRSSLKT